METNTVFVNCKLWLGAFSGERVFTITQVDGAEYSGIAPLAYCCHRDGHVLGALEPAPNASIDGKIAARTIRNGGRAAEVLIPDDEAIHVPNELLSARASRSLDVSLRS